MKNIKKALTEAGKERLKQFEEKRAKQQLEIAEFKEKLALEYGVAGHPKLDDCFRLAWEYGHSAGFQEVENYFIDLVDLIK